MNRLWTLAPASMLAGALAMWIFRRTTDPAALHAQTSRVQAHLLEFWIFVDEPSQIWKSWQGLILANVRLQRLLLVPVLILSLVMVPLFFVLDAFYGSSPLAVGKATLVTLGFDRPLAPLDAPPRLQAPDGISVETPGVRVFSQRQISWRIRPRGDISGQLAWTLGSTQVVKSVTAGGRVRWHSPKRTRSLVEWIRYPTERPLAAGPVAWIEVAYPETAWVAWFVLFSLLGAQIFRKILRR